MAGTRPIYGFQAFGVDGSDMPDATVEEMASSLRRRDARHAQRSVPHRRLLGRWHRRLRDGAPARGDRRAGQVPRAVRQRSARQGRAAAEGGAAQHGCATSGVTASARSSRTSRPHLKWSLQSSSRSTSDEPNNRRPTSASSGSATFSDFGFVNLFYYFSAAADKYQMERTSRSMRRCSRPSGCGRHSPTTTTGAGTSTARSRWPMVPGDHKAMFFPENAPAPRRGAHADPRTSRLTSCVCVTSGSR